ncbi:unnamed protein product [Sphagnum balticum]
MLQLRTLVLICQAIHWTHAQQYQPAPAPDIAITQKRATCDESKFYFYIEFSAPFGGRIYARNSPECTYVNTEVDGQRRAGIGQDASSITTVPARLFNITVPLTNGCGTERTDGTDYEQYSMRMNVDRSTVEDGTHGYVLVCRHRKIDTTTATTRLPVPQAVTNRYDV